MSYHRQIPEKHVERASFRLPSTGETRFHTAIKNDWDGTGLLWIKEPNCPWNKRNKEGIHPFCDVVAALYSALGKSKEDVNPKEMPKWWRDIYPNDTQEDWIRKETQAKDHKLEHATQIFEAFLPHVEWSKLKISDVESILKHATTFYTSDARHSYMDKMIESGLPLHLLKFKNLPATPAMWCMIHKPYTGTLDYWLQNSAIPLDPPGDTPGFLSALVMMANSRYDNTNKLYYATQAIARGCELNRPVYSPEDVPSKEKLYYTQRDDHLNPKTLSGQLYALGDPGLIGALVNLPESLDLPRIESAIEIMKMSSSLRVDIAKDSSALNEQIQSLIRVLEHPPHSIKTWSDATELTDSFLLNIWGNGVYCENPAARECWARIQALTGKTTFPTTTAHFSKCLDRFISNSSPKHIQAQISEGDILSQFKPKNAHFKSLVCSTLVNKIMQSGLIGSPEKARKALEHVLSSHTIKPEDFEELTKMVMKMPSYGVHLPHLDRMISHLERAGWVPTALGWEILHGRIVNTESHDSAEALLLLTEKMKSHRIPFECGGYLLPPRQVLASMPSNQHDYAQDGYQKDVHWDYEEASLCYQHFARAALDCTPSINDLPWSPKQPTVGVMERLANFMESSDKNSPELNPFNALILDTVEEMIKRGADMMYEHPDHDPDIPHWSSKINTSHPFMVKLAAHQSTELDKATQQPQSAMRSRRF